MYYYKSEIEKIDEILNSNNLNITEYHAMIGMRWQNVKVFDELESIYIEINQF